MKLFNIVNASGINQYRMPFAAYKTDVSYSSAHHFMQHESSTFLDMFLDRPYGEFSANTTDTRGLPWEEVEALKTNAVNRLAQIAFQGAEFPSMRGDNPSTKDPSKVRNWGFLCGFSDDEGHRMFVTEVKKDKQVVSMESMGVSITDPDRAPKDLRRLFSNYQYSWRVDTMLAKIEGVRKGPQGKKFPVEVAIFEKDGQKFAVVNHLIDGKGWTRYRKACVDGKMKVHPDCAKTAGLPLYSRTARAYGTVASFKFGKGVIEFDHRLGYVDFGGEAVPVWFVLYGGKNRVLFDKLFFGILSYCGNEPARSDMQAIINFEDDIWLEERAQQVLLDMVDAMHDEEQLAATMLRHLNKVEKKDTDTWCLIQWLEANASPFVLPGMFGKVVSHIMQKMFDAENGRMDIEDRRKRVLFDSDPHMFENPDFWGIPDLQASVIPAGTMVQMDVEGLEDGQSQEGTVYRQPSGSNAEQALIRIANNALFKAYAGHNLMFFGPDAFMHLIKMNGGDLDDHGLLTFMKTVVKHMSGLKYPTVAKLEEVAKDTVAFGKRLNKALNKHFYGGGYTAQTFVESMRKSLDWSMKIGQIVNLIMLDTLLSGRHKQNMLAYLKNRIANPEEGDNTDLYKKAYTWLKKRKDYILRKQASNLEALIDYTQQAKDLGQKDVLDALIEEMGKLVFEKDPDTKAITVHTMVLPETWAMENRNRIPKALKLNKDYVLAPSCVCVALAKVRQLRKTASEEFKAFALQLKRPLPLALENQYPQSDGLTDTAFSIREWWNLRMAKINEDYAHDSKAYAAAYHECLYGTFSKLHELTREGLVQKFEGYSEQAQEALACELWRIVYDPKWTRGDSVFVNNVTIAIFLRAAKRVGIAGHVESLEFAPYTGLYGKVVDVTIRPGGMVYRTRDNFWIGSTRKSAPTGDFKLTPWGMIMVQPADSSLRADMNSINFSGTIDVFGQDIADEKRRAEVKAAKAAKASAEQEVSEEETSDAEPRETTSDEWEALLASSEAVANV